MPGAVGSRKRPRIPSLHAFLGRACWPLQANRDKHELRGRLLALQGRGDEAASEVGFMGRQAEAEMCRVGKAAAEGPLGASVAALVPDAAAGGGEKQAKKDE